MILKRLMKNLLVKQHVSILPCCCDIFDEVDEEDFLEYIAQTIILSSVADILSQILLSENEYDFQRTVRFSIVALMFSAPILYLWSKHLASKYGSDQSEILYKIIEDQLIFAPLALVPYIISHELVAGANLGDAVEVLKSKYIKLLLANYYVWPLAHLFNLYVIPSGYNVLFSQIITVLWSIFISFVLNDKGPVATE